MRLCMVGGAAAQLVGEEAFVEAASNFVAQLVFVSGPAR
jgi:hypothetical protein